MKLLIAQLQTYYPQGRLQASGLSDEYGYDDYFEAYTIEAGETAVFQPQFPLDINWADQIQLVGYDLPSSSYKLGEQIEVTLYLRALQKMDVRYTTFMHFIDPVALEQGQPPVRGQQDVEPCHTYYPTSVWYPEEVIILDFGQGIPPQRLCC